MGHDVGHGDTLKHSYYSVKEICIPVYKTKY